MTYRSGTLLGVAAFAACAAFSSAPAAAFERSLHEVAAPERALIGTTVEDVDGRFVGRVASVTLDRYGDPDAVQIDNGSQVVTVDADELAYDDRAGTVVAQLTRDDIDDMY